MAKEKIKYVSFKEYLSMLSKEDLESFSLLFDLNHKKSISRKKLEELVYSNLDNIVISLMTYFGEDDYYCLKKIIHNNGFISMRQNHILEYFIKNLTSKNLMIQIDEINYYMPLDMVKMFKKTLKKVSQKLFKNNTIEYSLILGLLDAYGVIEFSDFYDIYAKDYKVSEKDAMERITELSNFYGEFKIKKTGKKAYLVNLIIDDKAYKKYIYKKGYAVYTNEELRNIHNLSYFAKMESFKKYQAYLKKKYFIEKNNNKIILKKILLPFFAYNQLNKEKARIILESNIESFFEIIDKKDISNLSKYIIDVSHDYPRWELKGHSEKEKVC